MSQNLVLIVYSHGELLAMLQCKWVARNAKHASYHSSEGTFRIHTPHHPRRSTTRLQSHALQNSIGIGRHEPQDTTLALRYFPLSTQQHQQTHQTPTSNHPTHHSPNAPAETPSPAAPAPPDADSYASHQTPQSPPPSADAA